MPGKRYTILSNKTLLRISMCPSVHVICTWLCQRLARRSGPLVEAFALACNNCLWPAYAIWSTPKATTLRQWLHLERNACNVRGNLSVCIQLARSTEFCYTKRHWDGFEGLADLSSAKESCFCKHTASPRRSFSLEVLVRYCDSMTTSFLTCWKRGPAMHQCVEWSPSHWCLSLHFTCFVLIR